ncbi:MAG: RNA polymerase sigma-70 factor [Parabacteroides sp.]|nr:RNA polymerase sigma-70 factor [Parabacteroides sp.]
MGNKASLVERLRGGDRTAFNEIYELYYLSVRLYADLMLDSDDAEDIVQDVFLNLWLHRDGLDETLSLRGYLLRSVYNSALNLLKKKKHAGDYYSSCEKEIEEMEYNYYDPDSCDIIRRLYNADLRADLQAAIDSLPARCQEVFTLSYLQDMPSKEISRKLGISLSTMDNHIYSTLKHLRNKLEGYKTGLVLLVLFFLQDGKNLF